MSPEIGALPKHGEPTVFMTFGSLPAAAQGQTMPRRARPSPFRALAMPTDREPFATAASRLPFIGG